MLALWWVGSLRATTDVRIARASEDFVNLAPVGPDDLAELCPEPSSRPAAPTAVGTLGGIYVVVDRPEGGNRLVVERLDEQGGAHVEVMLDHVLFDTRLLTVEKLFEPGVPVVVGVCDASVHTVRLSSRLGVPGMTEENSVDVVVGE